MTGHGRRGIPLRVPGQAAPALPFRWDKTTDAVGPNA